jgi:hypothetical protein
VKWSEKEKFHAPYEKLMLSEGMGGKCRWRRRGGGEEGNVGGEGEGREARVPRRKGGNTRGMEVGGKEGRKEGRREGGTRGTRETEDGGTEGQRDGGTEGRRGGGTEEGRRDGGEEGQRRDGGTEGRRDEGGTGGKGKIRHKPFFRNRAVYFAQFSGKPSDEVSILTDLGEIFVEKDNVM